MRKTIIVRHLFVGSGYVQVVGEDSCWYRFYPHRDKQRFRELCSKGSLVVIEEGKHWWRLVK